MQARGRSGPVPPRAPRQRHSRVVTRAPGVTTAVPNLCGGSNYTPAQKIARRCAVLWAFRAVYFFTIVFCSEMNFTTSTGTTVFAPVPKNAARRAL